MLVCTAGGEGCVESMSRDGAGAGTGPGNPVPSGVTLVAARNACLSVCLSVSPVRTNQSRNGLRTWRATFSARLYCARLPGHCVRASCGVSKRRGAQRQYSAHTSPSYHASHGGVGQFLGHVGQLTSDRQQSCTPASYIRSNSTAVRNVVSFQKHISSPSGSAISAYGGHTGNRRRRTTY